MARCYLCDSANIAPAFTKNNYRYLRCRDCGLYRLDLEEPYQDFLNRYYDKGYFTGDPKRCAYVNYRDEERTLKKNMHIYLDEILKYKKGGSLLDVGSSIGFFLELAQDKGFDVRGIDVSAYAVKNAVPTVKDAITRSDLLHADFAPGSFDVITMFDVIEHLQDPRAELKKAHKLLKEGGILTFETGNQASLWAKAWGKHWHFFAPPQHLFVYSAQHLKTLLDQAGFTIRSVSSHNKWVSLRYLFHLTSSIGNLPLTDRLSRFFNKHPPGRFSLYLPLYDKIIVTAVPK